MNPSLCAAPDIPLGIDLHTVGDARTVAGGFGPDDAVGDSAVGLHIVAGVPLFTDPPAEVSPPTANKAAGLTADKAAAVSSSRDGKGAPGDAESGSCGTSAAASTAELYPELRT